METTELYFSEREKGQCPRDRDEISQVVWGGVQVLIQSRVNDGSFGATYPETCLDGGGPVGTDVGVLQQAMRAEIPDLQEALWDNIRADPPPDLVILDTIEFCWRCIGKPIAGFHHDYFKHRHLTFDVKAGQREFREGINRIFSRNGMAYELKENGYIERLMPTVLRELVSAHFFTGDSELDRMLETACRKFLDHNEAVRLEALNVLWDAWERLKTVGSDQNKREQVANLLDTTAGPRSPGFREALEKDARELTAIGNNLLIRHSEREKEPIVNSKHVDYLFHRLFALIQLILRTNPAL